MRDYGVDAAGMRGVSDSSRMSSIYTDGACSGNPGPGGWGAILKFGDDEKELKGGEAHTTNNRMELMAAISALEALKKPCVVDLTTDSQYVRQGITGWIHGWKRNGWRTADKKPVKNVELWQRLDAALKPHEVRWHWVKGHAGHDENERADQLARDGVAMARLKASREWHRSRHRPCDRAGDAEHAAATDAQPETAACVIDAAATKHQLCAGRMDASLRSQ